MLHFIEDTRLPELRVPPWSLDTTTGNTLFRLFKPMTLLYSEDLIAEFESVPAGWYRHLSISRPDRHPGWEHQQKAVAACPWFRPYLGKFMWFPPNHQYVNLHKHCFHWWQKVEE